MGAVVFSGPGVCPMPEPEEQVVAAEVAPEPAAGPEAAAEVVPASVSGLKPKASGKRRARHPAGSEEAKPGTYVGDDPSTPADEAWEGDDGAAKG